MRNELERDSKIVVPTLPSKALKRQMPFRSDDGVFSFLFLFLFLFLLFLFLFFLLKIVNTTASPQLNTGIYEEDFIEERRSGLEGFVNKIAGHPLAQNERCLHMFLQV